MPLTRSTPRIDSAVEEIRQELLRHVGELEGSTGLMSLNLRVRYKRGGTKPVHVIFGSESEHQCS